jgi:creatinine amidohydrolase
VFVVSINWLTDRETWEDLMSVTESRMQEMTWPEIELAMRRGADTVVIVAAAHEQHGPHLPPGTDVFWGEELGLRLVLALGGRALLAPVIPFGPDEEMMGFPGTVSLGEETLVLVLRDICASYARHGFRNAILLSSHEGDYRAMTALGQETSDLRINVLVVDDIAGLVDAIYEAADKSGIEHEVAGAHSGEFETSLALAAFPAKVRADKLARGVLVDLARHPGFMRQDLRQVTPNGIIGDATRASQAQGNLYWNAVTQFVIGSVTPRLVGA